MIWISGKRKWRQKTQTMAIAQKEKKDDLEEYSRKEKICLSHIYRDSTQD